jgi:hypothetical protein
MKHPSDVPLLGRLLVLPIKNKLGCQGLPGANTLAYYEESVVDKFKSNLLLMIFWLHIINYNS